MRNILIVAFLCLPAMLIAQSATSLLDKAAKAYNESNGVKSDFTMRIRSDQQKTTESFEGEIEIKGNKFTLVTPDMQIWYDGKTLWTYMLRTGEVNVTNPENEELQFLNPTLLLNNYKKGFDVGLKGESTSLNGKSAYDIRLTPKKKNQVTEVLVQIEKLSGMPSSIVVTGTDKTVSTIHITKIQTGLNQPDRSFVFKESDYPEAEVIDLR